MGRLHPHVVMRADRATWHLEKLFLAPNRGTILSKDRLRLSNSSELDCVRLALSFDKIGCAREFESKLSFHSLALSLDKIGCAREFESKLSFHSLALSLQPSCTPILLPLHHEKTIRRLSDRASATTRTAFCCVAIVKL